jgi:hypothetical protein
LQELPIDEILRRINIAKVITAPLDKTNNCPSRIAERDESAARRKGGCGARECRVLLPRSLAFFLWSAGEFVVGFLRLDFGGDEAVPFLDGLGGGAGGVKAIQYGAGIGFKVWVSQQ